MRASQKSKPSPAKPQSITAALFSGYPAFGIARVCCCSQQTAYHWKSGLRRPSARALRLWMLHRDEQVLTAEFRGFRVRGGELIDPDGNSLTVAQLRWFQFLVGYAADLARRLGPDEQARFWDEIMPRAG